MATHKQDDFDPQAPPKYLIADTSVQQTGDYDGLLRRTIRDFEAKCSNAAFTGLGGLHPYAFHTEVHSQGFDATYVEDGTVTITFTLRCKTASKRMLETIRILESVVADESGQI